MKLIKEICHDSHIKCEQYVLRKASRALVFNDKNEIAILNVRKHNYYKIPGGGIEQGENVAAALAREVKEEVGTDIEILGELGVIIEYYNSVEFMQISYCFVAKVKGEIKPPKFDAAEIADGFALEWHSLDKAIALFRSLTPTDYRIMYRTERDLAFLKEYKKERI